MGLRQAARMPSCAKSQEPAARLLPATTECTDVLPPYFGLSGLDREANAKDEAVPSLATLEEQSQRGPSRVMYQSLQLCMVSALHWGCFSCLTSSIKHLQVAPHQWHSSPTFSHSLR